MEKVLDKAIAEREAIRDYETVLRLMWIEAANMTEEEKIEEMLHTLLRTG